MAGVSCRSPTDAGEPGRPEKQFLPAGPFEGTMRTVQWLTGKPIYVIVPLFPFLLLKIMLQELEAKVVQFYVDH